MITVNEIKFINNATKVLIDVQAAPGYNILDVRVYTDYSYPDNTKAYIPVAAPTNRRVFTVDAKTNLGLDVLNGLIFLHISSDEPNPNHANCPTCPDLIAVSANLAGYYRCALNHLLKTSNNLQHMIDDCNCGDMNSAMAVNLFIDGIKQALMGNRFAEAIDLLINLRTLCNSCTDCYSFDLAAGGCADCSQTYIFEQ